MLDEGTAAVIAALGEAGVLLREERYAHKYPYDWRTRLPTIFRTTPQACAHTNVTSRLSSSAQWSRPQRLHTTEGMRYRRAYARLPLHLRPLSTPYHLRDISGHEV